MGELAMAPVSFGGFDPALPDILAALRERQAGDLNNCPDSRYEQICVKASLEFIGVLRARLAQCDPAHKAIAEIGKSFRNRQDNAYAGSAAHLSYLHMVFWAGNEALKSPTLHLVLSAGGLGVGAGQWQFDQAQLGRYRHALLNEAIVDELVAAIKTAKQSGCHLEKPQLKKSPFDVSVSGEARQLSLHTGLVVRNRNESYRPEMFTPDCVDMIVDRLSALFPFQKWLMKNVYETH